MRYLSALKVRPWLSVVVVGVVAFGMGATFVSADGTPTTFYACLTSAGQGSLYRVNTTAAPTRNKGDTPVSWNQLGPTRPAGRPRAVRPERTAPAPGGAR